MNGWTVTYLIMYALSLGIHLARHGHPRESNYNFFTALFSMIISMFILYKAGLFG